MGKGNRGEEREGGQEEEEEKNEGRKCVREEKSSFLQSVLCTSL